VTEEDGGALPEGKPQVAVIGTRRMGAAMVARLRSAGADVVDVQPDRGRGLAERVGASLPQAIVNSAAVSEAVSAGFGQQDMAAMAHMLRQRSI
jgi:3-hydroxyisobutyrate dehydrogenase-like beta-hydroxyacid dehydrogenase